MLSPGMKILVVDDSKVMRHIIRNHLNAMGFANVHESSGVRLALEVLAEETVDLIFSDWVMPGLHGIELLRQVRANPATRHIPLIMVTAEAQPHLIFEAVQAGVSDYVVKPFTRDTLKQSMEKVFRFEGAPSPGG